MAHQRVTLRVRRAQRKAAKISGKALRLASLGARRWRGVSWRNRGGGIVAA